MNTFSARRNVPRLFYGGLITPQSPFSIKYLPQALISIDNGVIQWIEEDVSSQFQLEAILIRRGVQTPNVVRLQRGQFLIPGFIDTHTHAPQFPNLGRGGQYELLDWLSNLTFPTEAKFGDEVYARKVYKSVVRRLLDCGTTTCCYFSSTHLIGTNVLADVVNASGQRAFIGKCNMDRNAPGSYLDPSPADSLDYTRKAFSYINSLNSPLVRPIITPRFAISCTNALLNGLGDIARDQSFNIPTSTDCPLLPIQTHISENKSEVLYTASLFPTHASYAAIYKDHGLLGPTTILAHGCHLTSDETALIKKAGAGISHCPTSNFNLTSGVARVGEWLDEGIKVGLGTDVSGGFSPSMLTAIQHASMASKVVALQVPANPIDASVPEPAASAHGDSNSINMKKTPAETLASVADAARPHYAGRPLPVAALLHMATLGGAQLCNLEETTGSLAPGKAFDALLVDLRPETGNPNVWWDDETAETPMSDLESSLEKFLFCGDDRNISAVFVHGALVGGTTFEKGK